METMACYEASLEDAPSFAGALIGANVMFCITFPDEKTVSFLVPSEDEARADKAWEEA